MMTLSLEKNIGKLSIIDTDSSYIYIGTLVKIEEDYIIMENVDVHDTNEGKSTKEQYLINAKKVGVKPNRKSVYILKDKVTSISLFDDVIEY